jgi:hypothetical protein
MRLEFTMYSPRTIGPAVTVYAETVVAVEQANWSDEAGKFRARIVCIGNTKIDVAEDYHTVNSRIEEAKW